MVERNLESAVDRFIGTYCKWGMGRPLSRVYGHS